MRYTEVIPEDHAVLRRGLNILDRMVQRMEEGQLIEIFDIRAVTSFLRGYGERYSQVEVQDIVGAIEASLSPKHGIEFVRSSRRLILLLRNQMEQEQVEAIAEQSTTSPIHAETYAGFARLERKYAPKPRATPLELDRRAHA